MFDKCRKNFIPLSISKNTTAADVKENVYFSPVIVLSSYSYTHHSDYSATIMRWAMCTLHHQSSLVYGWSGSLTGATIFYIIYILPSTSLWGIYLTTETKQDPILDIS